MDLTIYLPFGSEPGTDDLRIVRKRGKPPTWSGEAEARLENFKTTVHPEVDARRWKVGQYRSALAPQICRGPTSNSTRDEGSAAC